MTMPEDQTATNFIALLDEIPPLFFRLRAFAEALHGETGMTAARRAVLRDVVLHEPLSAPQLAAMRSLTRQAVQPVIDELSEAGFVRAEANPNHKRSHLITATAAGRRLHSRLRDAEMAAFARFAPEISERDLAAALRLIRTISETLERRLPEVGP